MQLCCQDSRMAKASPAVSSTLAPTYLFLGEFKYWFDPPLEDLDTVGEGEYVLNRARLFYDRRDFIIQPGDTRFPEGVSYSAAAELPK